MTGRPVDKLGLRVIHGDLPTQIANQIGRRILNGDFKPGDQLPPETEFLSESGVSRTTMREAIKLLLSKGLVEAKPKLGTRVRPSRFWHVLDPMVLAWQFDSNENTQDLLSLFEVRRLIEPEASALAAARGTDAKLRAIGQAFDALEKASKVQINGMEADVAFHVAILCAAENKYLAALGSVIEMAIKSTVKVSQLRPGGLRHAVPLHKAVYDAIQARRPEVAKAHMRALIDDAEEDVRLLIGSKSKTKLAKMMKTTK